MSGGLGNDVYYVDVSGDVTTESAGQGVDTVNSSVTRTLAAHMELLFLTGISAVNGTGNTLANLLRGNRAANTLAGAGGTDILEGGAGAAIIVFNQGEGQDTVASSTTKDSVLALGGGILYADLLFQKSGNNLILKAGGTDQITFTMALLAAGGFATTAQALQPRPRSPRRTTARGCTPCAG